MIGFHHYIYNMDIRSDMAELVLNYLPQGGADAVLQVEQVGFVRCYKIKLAKFTV